MPQKQLLLVFNPMAGTRKFAAELYDVINTFTRAGYLVTAYPTQKAGDAREVILQRAEEFDLLVCSGGDGTLSEAVGALMVLNKKPPLGYIPAGTTNDFANSLGLPTDSIIRAVDIALNGELRVLDIGRFADDYFSYVAAFGLFTDVSYATPQSKKNVLGHMAYLLEGVKRLGSIQSHFCTITLDGGEVLDGDFLFGMVTNSLSVGGFHLPHAHEADIRMDDGLFEIALLRRPTNLTDLQRIIRGLINQEITSDKLIFRRVKSLTVQAQSPLAWTLDGEFGGELDAVSITNCSAAIRIMTPDRLPQPTAKKRKDKLKN